MDEVTFRVFRGEPDADGEPFGQMIDYTVTLDDAVDSTITCTATADDADGGTVSGTTSATVTNTGPTVDTISITPESGQVGDTLTCLATASDAVAFASAASQFGLSLDRLLMLCACNPAAAAAVLTEHKDPVGTLSAPTLMATGLRAPKLIELGLGAGELLNLGFTHQQVTKLGFFS